MRVNWTVKGYAPEVYVQGKVTLKCQHTVMAEGTFANEADGKERVRKQLKFFEGAHKRGCL